MKREDFINRLNTNNITLLQMLILFILIKTGKQVSLRMSEIDIFNNGEFFTEIQLRLFNEYSVVTLTDNNNNIIRYY